MDALILPSARTPRAALFDIAGKPLILRQIQWLRAVGCERIAVALPEGELATRVALALEQEPLGLGVSWGPASGSVEETLRERGLSACALVLPGDVLGDGDLVRSFLKSEDGGEIHLNPPEILAGILVDATLHLFENGSCAARRIAGPGWGVRLRSEEDAFSLSLAILDGGLSSTSKTAWPVQVHATKIHSGIWVAQGAVVHETANLIRPVFIGPNAVVGRDAVIGPSVTLGEAAQVGSLARLQSSVVERSAAVPASSEIADALVVPLLPSAKKPGRWSLGVGLGVGMLVAAALLVWWQP